MKYTRNDTKKIFVGGVAIGGGARVTVQSMTNTKTGDVRKTVEQILALEEAGCDIIRVAVPDMEAAEAIKDIKRQIHIPLVADIHFDHRLALKAIENGIDKVRINPGNIGDISRTKEVVALCKERKIPIRIGVNGGSLEKDLLVKYGSPCPDAIVESAMGHVNILESLDFGDIAISLKSSDVMMTVESYLKLSRLRNYPLHVGVTEAGTLRGGTVKSCAGIGIILAEGIGDTIRVSLTADPVEEVYTGKLLLQALNLEKGNLTFISCPTCGRCKVNLVEIAGKVEEKLIEMDKKGQITRPLKVAVMGCGVNGPGEAKEADIGLAGGDGCGLIFVKGIPQGKLYGEDIAQQFVEKVKSII